MTSPARAPKPAKKLTLGELLDQQHLTISRPQALDHGMSRHAWAHKLESGRWTAVGDGVAVAHSGEPDDLQLRWAADLHGGKDAAITGDAALVHFGAKRLTVVQHDIVIPPERRMRTLTTDRLTVVPHRAEGLARWTAGHPHLRLANVHAATLHAASWAPTDEEAEHRLTLVVQQRLSTPGALRVLLDDMPRIVRRALMRVVLDDVELGATAQSELDFLRFCRRNGLPEPDAMQLKVRAGSTTRYLDVYYRGQRIILEIDGAHHRWAAQWNADALRTLQLVVAHRETGEQVVRVTRAMMRHQEAETAALLRELLLPVG